MLVKSLVIGLATAGIALGYQARQEKVIKRAATASKPYLGVFLADADEGKRGAEVREVVADGPGAKAGVKVGDVVESIDGKSVEGAAQAAEIIGTKKTGDSLAVKITRDGKEQKLTVKLGDRPGDAPTLETPAKPAKPDSGEPSVKAQPKARGRIRIPRPGQGEGLGIPTPVPPTAPMQKKVMLGVQLQPLDDELRERLKAGDKQGVVISDVVPKSAAEKAGVKSEDIVVGVDGKDIVEPKTLVDYVAAKKAGDSLTLKLLRDGKTVEKTLKLEALEVPGEGQSGVFRFDPRQGLPPNMTPEMQREFERLFRGGQGFPRVPTPMPPMMPSVKKELEAFQKELKALDAKVSELSKENETLRKEIEALKAARRPGRAEKK